MLDADAIGPGVFDLNPHRSVYRVESLQQPMMDTVSVGFRSLKLLEVALAKPAFDPEQKVNIAADDPHEVAADTDAEAQDRSRPEKAIGQLELIAATQCQFVEGESYAN